MIGNTDTPHPHESFSSVQINVQIYLNFHRSHQAWVIHRILSITVIVFYCSSTSSDVLEVVGCRSEVFLLYIQI